MKQGLALQFIPPSADAFTETLLRLPEATAIILVGTNALAQGITERNAQGGTMLEVYPQLPPQAVLERTRVLILTEQNGERLGDQLLACIDLTEILILAPVTERHFSRMPVFVVTIPKGGTHLVYQLLHVLGYTPGVEPPDYPKPQTWYCLEYSNTHTVARDFFVDTVRRSAFGNRHHLFALCPVLFGYRHPLDILVSEAHYYHRPGKTIFAGYFDGDDLEGRVRRLIDDEWLLGSLRQRVGGFLPWFRFPNVIPASFEELVGEAGGGTNAAQQRLIWSIMLKLQVDGSVSQIIPQLFAQNAETFREGKIGSHRTQLSAQLIEELRGICGDVISEMGYVSNDDSLIPVLAQQRAKRPLRYTSVNFDRMPLNVEQDFMGCNLVRYAQQFYAIPISAGSLNVDPLSDEQLERLPSADKLTELKTLLQIGRTAYEHQCIQLSQAGLSIKGEEVQQESLPYWIEAAAPQVYDTYKGFNFIRWKGRHYAIRQEIGKVDLSQDVPTLLARHPPADVLISHTPESLFRLVDDALERQAVQETLNTLTRGTNVQAQSLNEAIAVLSTRMLGIERSVAEAMNTLTERSNDQVRRLDEAVTELSTRMLGVARNVDEAVNSLTEQTKDQARSLDETMTALSTRILGIERAAGEAASHLAEQISAQMRTLEKTAEDLSVRLRALEQKYSVRIAHFLTSFLRRRG